MPERTDLHERFGALDGLPAPDLWQTGLARQPRSGAPRRDSRPIVAAVVALAVTVAAIALVAKAFFGGPPARRPINPGPKANGAIAFITGHQIIHGPGSEPRSVYLMNAHGSGLRLLRGGLIGLRSLSWSPDGKRLAIAMDSRIFIMREDGSGLTAITPRRVSSFLPAWSPDGSRLAFVRMDTPNGNRRIFVMNADGSGTRKLTEGPRDYYPSWSPSGDKILYAHEGELREISPDGGDAHVIYSCAVTGCTAVSSPHWSPDGSNILFIKLGPPGLQLRIDTVDPTGRNEVTLYECRLTCGGINDANWSPDGRRIVFTKYASRTDRQDVFVMNADGSNPTKLTRGVKDEVCCPAWQPLTIGQTSSGPASRR
jgi:Tol biopolymer transport system component